VSATLGYRDGEATPPTEMLAAVGRIARAVAIPVTADMEGGYGMAPNDLVDALIDAGVSGLNFEDTDHSSEHHDLVAPMDQAERIAALRDAAGDRLVINARIDLWARDVGDPATRVEAALERARAYVAAGADCVFPILLSDEESIRRFAAQAGAPVNIFWTAAGPSLARLAELGVARVSFGSAIHRAAFHEVATIITALRNGDDAPLRGA
jgi:2-methylisocitrate lyase-like PEP mutase family enzyme